MALEIKRRLTLIFGEDAMDWFHTSYLLDWAVIFLVWLIVQYIKLFMPVFERSFSLDDPLISHPHRKDRVSPAFNQLTAFVVPSAVILATGLFKKSLIDIHHGLIGLLATRSLATLVIDFLKHRIGRLRPDFLARCQWSGVIEKCAGKAQDIIEGRKSFPSGHSATAFSGMFYVSLFMAGQTAAWCFHTYRSPKILSSRLVRLIVTMIPLSWATHVALTRMEDYRHHKEDVIVGSIVGILSASICYLIFWPNPCSATNFDFQSFGQPRSIYAERQDNARVEFHLTAVDEGNTNAV